MKTTASKSHSTAADVAAFCGMALLGGAGMALLCCDVSESAPHWLRLWIISKMAGMALLGVLALGYRWYTGDKGKEE